MLLAQVPIRTYFPPASTFPTVDKLVNAILPNVLVLAGVMLFFLLIFGGLQFIIGAGNGDKESVGKGKNAITAALTGFLVIFAAYWIVEIVQYITGIQIF